MKATRYATVLMLLLAGCTADVSGLAFDGLGAPDVGLSFPDTASTSIPPADAGAPDIVSVADASTSPFDAGRDVAVVDAGSSEVAPADAGNDTAAPGEPDTAEDGGFVCVAAADPTSGWGRSCVINTDCPSGVCLLGESSWSWCAIRCSPTCACPSGSACEIANLATSTENVCIPKTQS